MEQKLAQGTKSWEQIGETEGVSEWKRSGINNVFFSVVPYIDMDSLPGPQMLV
jgi:hypothetical protein